MILAKLKLIIDHFLRFSPVVPETIDFTRYGDLAPAMEIIHEEHEELPPGESLQKILNTAETNFRIFGVSILPGISELVGVIDTEHSLAGSIGEISTAFIHTINPQADPEVIADSIMQAAQNQHRFAVFRLPPDESPNAPKSLRMQAGNAITEMFVHIRASQSDEATPESVRRGLKASRRQYDLD